MNGLLKSVLEYERAGIKRENILSIVKEQLKAVDEKRKGIKEQIVAELKPLGAIDGYKAVNVICSTGSCGTGNAATQRLKRRRDWLKSLLESTHPDYDFIMVDGIIDAVYIGDALTREAKSLFKDVSRLISLDCILDGQTTVQDILAALKTEVTSEPHETETEELTPVEISAMQEIADKLEARLARQKELQQEKEAKQA